MLKNIMHHVISKNPVTARQSILRPIAFATLISGALLASGCSVFGVYKIDLPQGTPITQTQAKRVQVGMNKNQVLYLLGSPALRDTLAPNRWDYVYDYTPGTYGKRERKPAVHDGSQHLIIYFNDTGAVSRIEGINSLPVK